MKAHLNSNPGFEFCFPGLDTWVRVDLRDDEVLVRATRDSFSEARKICFIRELAAEGFIPDAYQWFSGFASLTGAPVRWLVDARWLKLNPAQIARTRAFMIRLIVGATALWLAMMTALFCASAINGPRATARPAARFSLPTQPGVH